MENVQQNIRALQRNPFDPRERLRAETLLEFGNLSEEQSQVLARSLSELTSWPPAVGSPILFSRDSPAQKGIFILATLSITFEPYDAYVHVNTVDLLCSPEFVRTQKRDSLMGDQEFYRAGVSQMIETSRVVSSPDYAGPAVKALVALEEYLTLDSPSL